MTPEQIKIIREALKDVVHEEFESAHQAFWIPAERHYREHAHLERCVLQAEERTANHHFVSGWRKKGNIAFNTSWVLIVAGACGLIWAIFSDGFRAILFGR